VNQISMRILSIAVILLALVAPSQATPTLTNIGINGSVMMFDCAVRDDGTCRSAGNFLFGEVLRGPSSSTFRVSDGNRGSAEAWGRSSDTSYLPELHAYGTSKNSYQPPAASPRPGETGYLRSVADANIWGVQGYLYTGLSPFDLTITVSSHSVIGQGRSDFGASIFDGNGYVFSYGDFELCPIYFLGHCSPTDPNRNITPFDHVEGTLFSSGWQTLTLHHTVNSGDRFYVGAFLGVNACCGHTVDSSHTLSMAFNDFSQLESLAVPGVVPEPGSILLVLIGLGLVWRQRKTSKNPHG